MKNLLALSDSISGIEQQLNRYFYSNNYKVDPENLAISNHILGTAKVDTLGIKIIENKLGYALYQIKV